MNDTRWNIVFIGLVIFVAIASAILLEGEGAAYLQTILPLPPKPIPPS
jgi:hypothetical protein